MTSNLRKVALQLRWAAKRTSVPFFERSLPKPLRGIETMLSRQELRMLYGLGAEHWDGRGVIVDAGCFLGGSTVALGEGLKSNPKWQATPIRPAIHSYDLFKIEEYTIGSFFKKDAVVGSSFIQKYQDNIRHVHDMVSIHIGDITATPWSGEKIEVLFIDLAKHWIVNDFVVQQFFPSLIPGHSIIVQQDYIYQSWNGWLAVTMEYLSEYFTLVDHAKTGSVLFKLNKAIEPAVFGKPLFQSLTRSQIFELMDRAIGRFSGSQKAKLMLSKQHLMAILANQTLPIHP